MFDQNDQNQQTDTTNSATDTSAVNPGYSVPEISSVPDETTMPSSAPLPTPTADPLTSDISAQTTTSTQTDASSVAFSAPQTDVSMPELSSTTETTGSTVMPEPVVQNNAVPALSNEPVVTTEPDDGLLGIKKEALQNLSPLLSQLDQSPEEKFRTTMMLIQASDDQSLIQTAYDTAKAITDEKVRAQALLDIVNEINYFTQQKSDSNTAPSA